MSISLFSNRGLRMVDAYTGPWEPPVSRSDRFHDAVEREFELLIDDPAAIERAFSEGFRIDAVAAQLWAELARESSPSRYEAVAMRIEVAIRDAICAMAEDNVRGGE